MTVDELEGRLTLDIPTTARLLGISRNTAYQEANRYLSTGGAEGLPVIRLGRRLLCPVERLRALLDPEPRAEASSMDRVNDG